MSYGLQCQAEVWNKWKYINTSIGYANYYASPNPKWHSLCHDIYSSKGRQDYIPYYDNVWYGQTKKHVFFIHGTVSPQCSRLITKEFNRINHTLCVPGHDLLPSVCMSWRGSKGNCFRQSNIRNAFVELLLYTPKYIYQILLGLDRVKLIYHSNYPLLQRSMLLAAISWCIKVHNLRLIYFIQSFPQC